MPALIFSAGILVIPLVLKLVGNFLRCFAEFADGLPKTARQLRQLGRPEEKKNHQKNENPFHPARHGESQDIASVAHRNASALLNNNKIIAPVLGIGSERFVFAVGNRADAA